MMIKHNWLSDNTSRSHCLRKSCILKIMVRCICVKDSTEVRLMKTKKASDRIKVCFYR